MSADERRASSTVAQVCEYGVQYGERTSMIVMTASICSSRLTTGSVSRQR
jgi:hypothetical protein